MKTNFTLAQVLIVVFIISVSLQAWGQKNSVNNGNWTSSNTWGSTPPSNPIGNNSTVNIFHLVESSGLTVEGNGNTNHGKLTIKAGGVLRIGGDAFVKQSGKIIVEYGGILIVEGHLDLVSHSQIENDGYTVVTGDVKVNSAERVDNSSGQGFYVFGSPDNKIATSVTDTDENTFMNDSSVPAHLKQVVDPNYVLPIELLFFQSKVVTHTVQLSWATAMEDNFDFFTVERAGEDGNFQAVGEIKGKGFSTEEVNYNFTDTDPLAGLNLYRLKATDLDGSVEYHRIISAWVEKSRSEVIVYPNPVVGNEKLFISTNSHHKQEVIIADLFGNMLVKTTVNAGINELELPERLKAGSYLVSVTQVDGSKQHIRLLKN